MYQAPFSLNRKPYI